MGEPFTRMANAFDFISAGTGADCTWACVAACMNKGKVRSKPGNRRRANKKRDSRKKCGCIHSSTVADIMSALYADCESDDGADPDQACRRAGRPGYGGDSRERVADRGVLDRQHWQLS